MEFYSFRAMDTEVVLAAEFSAALADEISPTRATEPPSDLAAAGFQDTEAFIAACAQRFTRFSEQSELSQLNRSAGSWFQASPELFDLLHQAQICYAQTGGLFDPAILPDLRRAGYDRDLNEVRRQGAPARPQAPNRARPVYGDLRLDAEGQRVWLPPGMEIDLGGIAKGWIAEQAAHRLARYTPACAVSAGGDMVLCGLPQGQPTWEVELEDPFNPDRTLTLLRPGPGAVATSSIARRTWSQDGKKQHHLIDPRSGEPAQTAWISVTVITPQATRAEAFAKALLIAGPRRATTLVAGQNDLAFIAVDAQGKLWGSRNSLEQTE